MPILKGDLATHKSVATGLSASWQAMQEAATKLELMVPLILDHQQKSRIKEVVLDLDNDLAAVRLFYERLVNEIYSEAPDDSSKPS